MSFDAIFWTVVGVAMFIMVCLAIYNNWLGTRPLSDADE